VPQGDGRMSIFDDIPREDKEPRPDGEALFAYTNRSGRDEAQRVRQNFDSWLERYPETHRDNLIARLRSVNDDQHRSAFFELFLYRLLETRGHKIIAIEPKLGHTDKSPDFLAETPKQERFCVEAALVTGFSNQEVAARARLNTALAAIDNTASPAHFLDLKVTGTPAKPISIKKLKRELQSWIAALPKDETANQRAPFLWDEHGAKIQLNAWTRNKPGEAGRAIGVRRTPVIQIDPSREIRPALKKKATRYGKLDHPYLVALDAMGTHHRDEAVIDALLGTPYLRISKGPNGEEIVEDLRRPDGIWYGPPDGQPQNTRMSGVLALMRIDPWNFASKTGLLIPNPWATKALPQLDLGTAEMVQVGDKFERKEGKLMNELFSLPASWPEE
jgi:hypothetical protein